MAISKLPQNIEFKLFFLVSFLYGIGIFLFLYPPLNPIARLSTDAFLIITHSAILWATLRQCPDKGWLVKWLAAVFLATFVLEIMGVKTGAVFGSYAYGQGFLLQLWGVPVVIALNWAVIILSAKSLILHLTYNRWTGALLTAILILFFDLVLEPVAMRLDFWDWADGKIPLQNYFVWCLVAFTSALFTGKKFTPHALLGVYFLLQLLFFSVLLFALT